MLPDFSYYQGLSIFPESSLVPQILHNWRLFFCRLVCKKTLQIWTSFSWRRSLICCWVSLLCLHESQTTESILICRLVWQTCLQKTLQCEAAESCAHHTSSMIVLCNRLVATPTSHFPCFLILLRPCGCAKKKAADDIQSDLHGLSNLQFFTTPTVWSV